MTIEEELKQFIVTKYGSITNFCKKINMSQSTLSTIFTRGIQRTSITKMIEICNELGISVDALAEGKIINKEDYGKKDMELNQLIRIMTYAYYFTLNGKRLSETEMETVKNNFDLTIEILKQKREMLEKKKILDDFHESRDAYLKWQEIDKKHKEDKE